MLTTGAIIILATQALTLIGSVIGVVQAMRNKKAIQEIHVMVNSQLTEFKQLIRTSSHAEGRLEGVEAQRKTDGGTA